MATPDQRRTEPTTPAAGVEGDGMEAYPTYRDGPVTPHRVTTQKPTDVGLPKARRTYALPIIIGLVVFAVVIVLRIVWGGINVARTSDEALSSGDPATPPAASAPVSSPSPAEAPSPSPASGAQVPEPQGNAGAGETEGAAGPGEVGAEPGPVDVPGGALTEPVEPAPQQ